MTALALPACFTPQAVLPGGRPSIELLDFPEGSEQVELPVGDGSVLRGVFVPGQPGAPVVLHLLEATGSITLGARPMTAAWRVDEHSRDASRASETPRPTSALGTLDPLDGFPLERSTRAFALEYGVVAQLRALGASTLIVDYRGIGASTGERNPDHLRADARAAWDEAVRRAGGDARRVVLRGTSLGALAAATLLEEGVSPAAVVLVAPVRSETVVTNLARIGYGEPVALLANWFFSRPVDVDLLDVLAAVRRPLLVILPEADLYLAEDETRTLKQVTSAAGGTVLVRHVGHEELAIASRSLFAVELEFYERSLPGLFPDREAAAVASWREGALDEGLPARARLRDILASLAPPTPGLAAALALSDLSDDELCAVTSWSQWLPHALWTTADRPVLEALVSLDDPGGRLDPRVLTESLVSMPPLAARSCDELCRWVYGPEDLEKLERGSGALSLSLTDKTFQVEDRDRWARSLPTKWRRRLESASTLSASAIDRQVLRLLLRVAGVPERLTADGAALEVWRDGQWQVLELRERKADLQAGATGAAPSH